MMIDQSSLDRRLMLSIGGKALPADVRTMLANHGVQGSYRSVLHPSAADTAWCRHE